jgi:S-adenosylmethionine:tRNA ribosyltransferase-isomerase
MRTDELDFHLPSELIAQSPAPQREHSRLLHYRGAGQSISHRRFSDLPELLNPTDVLVFNDTRVIPARVTLKKQTGGMIDGLYLGTTETGQWRMLLRNVGAIDRSPQLTFAGPHAVVATVQAKEPDGTYLLEVDSRLPALELLSQIGRMPLPPYIRRLRGSDERDEADLERYQTVYASGDAGSVAAPTAGLHFTEALLKQLDARGVQRVHVTLHVGLGTFKPIEAERLPDHHMHEEAYSIDARAADVLNHAQREGRRIVAVGTTAARVLESQPAHGKFEAKFGATRIFIYPPYAWRHVGALITNFHLPRSTLIAMVAAFVGLDEQRRIYEEAIRMRYRFFSYGDASFLERSAQT